MMSEETTSPEREQSPRPHKRVWAATPPPPPLPLDGCGNDKSLFICSYQIDYNADPTEFSYVIRSINLAELLSAEKSELTQVTNLVDEILPNECACGVLGSQIVFAGGLKPNDPFGSDPSKDAYAFDVRDPTRGIVKLPGELNGGKRNSSMQQSPFAFEFNDKLYVLSDQEEFEDFVSFEAYDPKQGTWSRLPKLPSRGFFHSYAIVGTKLFISSRRGRPWDSEHETPIFCFDFASPEPEWRKMPGMCQGGAFPFKGGALVLDLPQQPEYKLLFSIRNDVWSQCGLVAHLFSLGGGDVSEIMEEMMVPFPAFPRQYPDDCHLFHLGGNNICLVTTSTRKPLGTEDFGGIEHTIFGAAVPFQFEFDISKVDKDRKNCFTGKFLHPRFFEYHNTPDSNIPPFTLGCFVL